jgi:hypothetical protein
MTRERSSADARMSFRASRERRARSASPTINRRTKIRVRDYLNEDDTQRVRLSNDARERIQAIAPKTPVFAKKVIEPKETSEGTEKPKTVDQDSDDSLHDSGIDLGDNDNSQKSTSVDPMTSTHEEGSGRDGCIDDEVCTATPEDSRGQRAVDPQEQSIVPEATAASGDAAPEPKPVITSKKPEGKRKRAKLDAGDEGDIHPAVRRCINKKYDGMLDTSKPDTIVESATSTSSPKQTTVVPVTSPVCEDGGHEKDEAAIQVTEQLDSQEQASVDAFQFPGAKVAIGDFQPQGQQHSLAYFLGLTTVEEIQKRNDLPTGPKKKPLELVKAFLQCEPNLRILGTYELGSETYQDGDDQGKNHTVIGKSWYGENGRADGRVELCGVMKWLEALLRPHQEGINLEDKLYLWPRLQNLTDDMKNISDSSVAEWDAYNRKVARVKNSNRRRDVLLAATNLSPEMFEDLLFTAQICRPNEHGGDVEESSLAALRDSLTLILDIVRLNDCAWRKDPFVDVEKFEKFNKDLLENYSDGMKGNDFLDCSLYEDAAALTGPFQVSGTPPSPSGPTVEDDSEAPEFEFVGDWKISFPPRSYMPPPSSWLPLSTSEAVVATDDNQEIPNEFKQLAGTYRTKSPNELKPDELAGWMDGYRKYCGSLLTVVKNSGKDVDLKRVSKAEGEEKQIWYRDHAIAMFRKMRKFINDWQDKSPYGPDNIHEGPIVDLLAQVDKWEGGMTEKLPDEPIKFPWVVVLCPRVQEGKVCEPNKDGLCCFIHDVADLPCRFGKNCRFGEQCKFSHPERQRRASRPALIPAIPSIVASRGSTPGSTAGSTTGSAPGPCPHVNQVGGCQNRKMNVCAYNHKNENVDCFMHKLPSGCQRGRKCAYLHRQPDATLSDKNRELKPLLGEVLQNPKKFRVCMYVNNTKTGCAEGGNCLFNHSLEGVVCPDEDSPGKCSRSSACPLLHKPLVQFQQPVSQQERSAVRQDITGTHQQQQATPQASMRRALPGSKRQHDQYAEEQKVATNIDKKRSRSSGGLPDLAGTQRYQVQGGQTSSVQDDGKITAEQYRSQRLHGSQQLGQQVPVNAPTGRRIALPHSPLAALGGRQNRGARQNLAPSNVPIGPRADQMQRRAPQASASIPQQSVQGPPVRQQNGEFSVRGAAGPDQHRQTGIQSHHATGGETRRRTGGDAELPNSSRRNGNRRRGYRREPY